MPKTDTLDALDNAMTTILKPANSKHNQKKL